MSKLLYFNSCCFVRNIGRPPECAIPFLSWAFRSSCPHVRPAVFASASVERRQVVFGRPRLRFPWGVHCSPVRVTLSAGFLSGCPSQRHLRLLICCSIGSWDVLFHGSSLLSLSYHRTPRIWRRQRFTKTCTLPIRCPSVSQPYRRTLFTLEL